FFERQELARAEGRKIVLLFLVALPCVISAVYVVSVGVYAVAWAFFAFGGASLSKSLQRPQGRPTSSRFGNRHCSYGLPPARCWRLWVAVSTKSGNWRRAVGWSRCCSAESGSIRRTKSSMRCGCCTWWRKCPSLPARPCRTFTSCGESTG